MPLHGGDPSVLRRLNSVATLRALRGGGEPTLTELANLVSLSRPTTEGALSELTARGLVEEVAPEAGRRLGRPARRYRFRAEAGHALGVEINAHRTLVYVADLDGRVVGGHRADLDVGLAPRERLSAVRGAARTALAEAGLTRSELWAVAAGTPGVIDADGRIAICTVVPGWQGVHLARELGRSFPCPVLVENDANLAAVAERWRGAAENVDDVVYVLAGLHTGAGALIGGRLHRGRWGAAGEVGTLPELGLRDTAAELAGLGTSPGPERPEPQADRAAEEILAAARAGEPAALARVDQVAGRMARGIAAMVLALDPEMVIVGGALTLTGDVLVRELRRHVLPLCLGPTRIEASTLGDESVGLGAVRLALDRIEADLLRLDPGPS
ncbi:ROK family transcriptional regulator [Actinomadura alba]|uniref:ROK family transcriptional regulator n=1 Tax=Actinomadura alba TaxID=406431 RepID=A0ABR7M1J7_9ACTN|nr:ROK family transcriptional regulator [Actinomadura alba]